MNIISGVHKQIFGLTNDERLRMFTTYTSYNILLGKWNVGVSEGLGMCCNEGDSV